MTSNPPLPDPGILSLIYICVQAMHELVMFCPLQYYFRANKYMLKLFLQILLFFFYVQIDVTTHLIVITLTYNKLLFKLLFFNYICCFLDPLKHNWINLGN